MAFDFTNTELIEKAVKGLLTRRQKRALVRYLSKPNRCSDIIYAAYQRGGLIRTSFFQNSDDTAFMLWGKVLDLDLENFDQNASYQFSIEPTVLKILFYYNRYYEKQYHKNLKHRTVMI